MQKIYIKLSNGVTVLGDQFDYNDFCDFQNIFRDWLYLNGKLHSKGGRSLPVPDVFSEAMFCYAYNAVRTNGTAYSYDCVMKSDGKGVQVKSASIEKDCTSFGPRSEWDLLYFADLAPMGEVTGEINFYQLTDFNLANLILNISKSETFEMQQNQGRRPRFSVKRKIIQEFQLLPEKTINILDGTITDHGIRYNINDYLNNFSQWRINL